jgi:hypothetical protein
MKNEINNDENEMEECLHSGKNYRKNPLNDRRRESRFNNRKQITPVIINRKYQIKT